MGGERSEVGPTAHQAAEAALGPAPAEDGPGAAPSIYSNTNNQQLLRGTAPPRGKNTRSLMGFCRCSNLQIIPQSQETIMSSCGVKTIIPSAFRLNISIINLRI